MRKWSKLSINPEFKYRQRRNIDYSICPLSHSFPLSQSDWPKSNHTVNIQVASKQDNTISAIGTSHFLSRQLKTKKMKQNLMQAFALTIIAHRMFARTRCN